MKFNIKETNKLFLKYIKKSWKSFSMWVFATICASSVITITPVYYKNFINQLTEESVDIDKLFSIIFFILFLNIIRWGFWRIAERSVTIAHPRIMRDIFESSYEYLIKHSYEFFINNFSGSLVKKIQRLARSIENITDRIVWNVIPLILKIIIGLFLIYGVQPIFSFGIFLWIVIFIIANVFFMKYRMKFLNLENKSDSKLSGFSSDTITNHLNISLFNGYKREQKTASSILAVWEKHKRKSWALGNIANAFQDGFMVLMEFLIFYFGITFWQKGLITIGDFVLIQTLIFEIFLSIWDFGRYVRDIGQGYSDAHEMVEILNTKHEITDKENAKKLKIDKGNIEIKNLNFSYESGYNIFKNFSLNIKSGEKIALISKSGEGKSTLTKLLLRLYNIDKKTILIDSQDIMNVTQNSIRNSIAFVPQEPILFHRTLEENISYGKPDATKEEIIEAAKKAHCHEFITNLKDGYGTFVGERGVKLSGGEKQRIAIARAILKNSPILILDEATSSLDSESEKLIQEALKELMKNKTTIVIAHRLSTISQMDKIVVIENHKITESGTHKELLNKKDSHYKMLWELQAGGFEN